MRLRAFLPWHARDRWSRGTRNSNIRQYQTPVVTLQLLADPDGNRRPGILPTSLPIPVGMVRRSHTGCPSSGSCAVLAGNICPWYRVGGGIFEREPEEGEELADCDAKEKKGEEEKDGGAAVQGT
jgi:hypothetical protein